MKHHSMGKVFRMLKINNALFLRLSGPCQALDAYSTPKYSSLSSQYCCKQQLQLHCKGRTFLRSTSNLGSLTTKMYNEQYNYNSWWNLFSKCGRVATGLSALAALLEYYRTNAECSELDRDQSKLQEKIKKARDIMQRVKDEQGCPGIVVAVSVDGKQVWSEGLGYANVEQRTPCTPDTVMRIASISKPIAGTILARLVELGRVDLDREVKHYVDYWPDKLYQGEKVDITVRQLLSHMSGVRHYRLCEETSEQAKGDENQSKKNNSKTAQPQNESKPKNDSKSESEGENESANKEKKGDTFTEHEYLLKKKFKDTKSSVQLFKDDDLCFKPGTDFTYTTHGFTLLAAVIEGVTELKYSTLAERLFIKLGMSNTYLDETQPLIYNRSGQYVKNEQGQIMNAPYVDVSYKWAGGGLLSTVADIVRFGNIMLYSSQFTDKRSTSACKCCESGGQDIFNCNLKRSKHKHKKRKPAYHNLCSKCDRKAPRPGYLKRETMVQMWEPVVQNRQAWHEDNGWYGMAWELAPGIDDHGNCTQSRWFAAGHTGGAVGGSSVVWVMPRPQGFQCCDVSQEQGSSSHVNSTTRGLQGSVCENCPLPQGVVVCLMVNIQGVSLQAHAYRIAQIFMTDS